MSQAPEYDVIVPKVDPMDERAEKAKGDPRAGEELVFTVIDPSFPGFNGQPLRDGEEFSVVVGTAAWNLTLDADGRSWLDKDADAQRVHFDGKVVFRPGPRGNYKAKIDYLDRMELLSNGGRKRVSSSRTIRGPKNVE